MRDIYWIVKKLLPSIRLEMAFDFFRAVLHNWDFVNLQFLILEWNDIHMQFWQTFDFFDQYRISHTGWTLETFTLLCLTSLLSHLALLKLLCITLFFHFLFDMFTLFFFSLGFHSLFFIYGTARIIQQKHCTVKQNTSITHRSYSV